MADDPRRAVLRQWHESVDALPQPRENAAVSRRNAEQQRPRPGTVVRRPSPPNVARDAAFRPAPGADGRTVGIGGVVLQHSAIRTDGGAVPSNGFGEEKGERDPADAGAALRKGHTYRHYQTQQRAPTAPDSYSVQRERLRRMQQRYAELQQAMHARTTVSSSTTSAVATFNAYYEMVSPVRPLEAAVAAAQPPVAMAARGLGENGNVDSNQAEDQRASAQASQSRQPTSRRRSPEDVMQEMDDNLWRSFNEHQRPSVSMSRDAAEMNDDEVHNDDAGEDDGAALPSVGRSGASSQPASPPPVVPVRVHEPPPPFCEEISSDASDFAVRSPPPSASMTMDENGDPYVSQYVPTSEDLGVHLPMSSDFESIPSISISPPGSPMTQRPPPAQAAPPPQTRSNQGRERYARAVSSNANDVIPSTSSMFPPWSLGFLAGCVVAGCCGLFMEEVLELFGVFFKSTLSRTERREMSRRLDLLQQELTTFRAAANEIELQSQQMVEEVRGHLDRMKQERMHHQEMISHEMETLRRYVQSVANELVEDEKQEIRKQLMETIKNAVAERSETSNQEDDVVESQPDEPSSNHEAVTGSTVEHPQGDLVLEDSIKSGDTVPTHDRALPEVIEIEVALATSNIKAFEPVAEAVVTRQVEAADMISSSAAKIEVSPAITSNGTQARLAGQAHTGSSSSFLSLEWVMLIAGVIAIVGAVGYRLQKANLRRNRFRSRRMWRSHLQVEETKSKLSDESDVETVSFMRGASESEADRGVEEEDDDAAYSTSVYSEEEEKHEDDMSSDGEYQFRAAHLSEGVEPLDESPARVSTSQSRQSRRLADESPLVRCSPRFPRRSALSSMR